MLDEIQMTPGEKRAIKLAKHLEELRLKRLKAVKPTRLRSPLEYIYFVKCLEFVKIGWATAMDTRMNNLRVNNPHPVELVGLMVGGAKEEAVLHAHFAKCHHRGEWFRITPDIQLLLNEIGGLDPIDARLAASSWLVRSAGIRGLVLFSSKIRAMRDSELDAANAVIKLPLHYQRHKI